MVRPWMPVALAIAAFIVLPAAAAPPALDVAPAPRGPVAVPCSGLPPAACDALAPVCALAGLLCAPPPGGAVAIFGGFPCSEATCGYDPATITIPVGASVVWTNTAGIQHSATSDDLLFDTGILASGASSDPILFPLAGTFAYHCDLHASMHGTVVVEG